MIIGLATLIASGALIVGVTKKVSSPPKRRRVLGKDITYGNYTGYAYVPRREPSKDAWDNSMLDREIRVL